MQLRKKRSFHWKMYGLLLQHARCGVSVRLLDLARSTASKIILHAKLAGHIEFKALDPLHGRMYFLTPEGAIFLESMESDGLDQQLETSFNHRNEKRMKYDVRELNYMKSKQAERMKQLLTMAVDGVSFKTYRNAGINIMTAHKYLKLAIASEYIALQMVRAHNERFYAITEKGQQALAAMP